MPTDRFWITRAWTVAPLCLALAASPEGLAQDQVPAAPDRAEPAPTSEPPLYRLDDRAGWTQDRQDDPEPGTPEYELREIRALLADDQAGRALTRLNAFIDDTTGKNRRYIDEAYLLRGDAKVARDEEFEALYDYERLIRSYPESEHFVTAIEREVSIAELYLEGLKLRLFGVRLIDGEDIAIELLIRTHERLPGSSVAERASLMIADYYYKKREMRLARDAYEVYLLNYPNGPNRVHAERRLIYADMARFKGPRYDGSALQDVRLRIKDFAERYPAEAASSGINEGLIARIDESTAAQLLESARWYLRQEDGPAARYTLRRLLRAHPETIAAQRARELMDENGWLLPDEEAGDQDATGVTIEGGAADQAEPVEPDDEESGG